VTPVLSLAEVAHHPQIVARGTVVEAFGQRQPAAAPRFADTPAATYRPPRTPGSDTATVFRDWGVDDRESCPVDRTA
jgi:alpha-methylacyl-CoA racemase